MTRRVKAPSNFWKVAARALVFFERLFHWSFLLRPFSYFIRENRLIDKCLEKQQSSFEVSWSSNWMSRSAKRRQFTQAVHQVLQVHKQEVDRSKIKRLWREIKRGEGVERIGDFIAKTWVIQKEIKYLNEMETVMASNDILTNDPSQQIYTYLKRRTETAFLWWQLQNPKQAELLKGQFVDYKVLEKFELCEDDVVTNFDLLDDQSEKKLWISETCDFKITIAQAHHFSLQEMCALIENGLKSS